MRGSDLSSRLLVKFTMGHERKSHATALQPGSSVAVVPIVELAGEDAILASRRKGERLRPLFEEAAGLTHFVVLDFTNAEVVTPSFLMGGLWWLWERGQVEQYPVIANLPVDAVDDVEIAAKMTRTPVWTGRLVDGRFRDPELIGDIEEPDELVLSLIFDHGSTSAGELAELDQRIGVTGWNNRLVGLWQRRVLMRTKEGRMFVYTVPWKVLENGQGSPA